MLNYDELLDTNTKCNNIHPPLGFMIWYTPMTGMV